MVSPKAQLSSDNLSGGVEGYRACAKAFKKHQLLCVRPRDADIPVSFDGKKGRHNAPLRSPVSVLMFSTDLAPFSGDLNRVPHQVSPQSSGPSPGRPRGFPGYVGRLSER